ncbi:MAG TPA: 6,7-dimethyl-8-ribityllumazine synthase [Bacteroidetes bacterium]|nr:6,7-dimethyl-8-ribityllumazine synthase [Bacteroidota bacterium]HIL57190.1 6,7-dimethyl-8-ribityllumazine synthase [Rhodothermales bacterium]
MTYEGSLVAPSGSRYAIVASRFNDAIVSKLVEGAQDALVRHGADADRVDVAWCPGAFELPVVAKTMAETGHYDAVICLGAVIRGATAHFDYVASGVTSGCTNVALDTGVPVMFGVITVDTLDQAWERAGTKAGNKGAEAAVGAIEMVSLLRAISGGNGTSAH